MMKTISINLVIQQDEGESVFLQKAVKAALQAFRKTHNEERQKYDHKHNNSISADGNSCDSY